MLDCETHQGLPTERRSISSLCMERETQSRRTSRNSTPVISQASVHANTAVITRCRGSYCQAARSVQECVRITAAADHRELADLFTYALFSHTRAVVYRNDTQVSLRDGVRLVGAVAQPDSQLDSQPAATSRLTAHGRLITHDTLPHDSGSATAWATPDSV